MAGSVTFERGEHYFNTRRARIVEYTPGQSRFVAEVKGSAPRPYRVQVEFDYILTGTCSCPVRLDCKHAVAAALQWLQQYELTVRTAMAAGEQPELRAVNDESAATNSPSSLTRSLLDEWLSQMPLAQEHGSELLEPGKHYLLYELQVVRQQVHFSLKKGYLKKMGSGVSSGHLRRIILPCSGAGPITYESLMWRYCSCCPDSVARHLPRLTVRRADWRWIICCIPGV